MKNNNQSILAVLSPISGVVNVNIENNIKNATISKISLFFMLRSFPTFIPIFGRYTKRCPVFVTKILVSLILT